MWLLKYLYKIETFFREKREERESKKEEYADLNKEYGGDGDSDDGAVDLEKFPNG